MSKPKSKREYVVGYRGDHQCVYGREGLVNRMVATQLVNRMTMNEAKAGAGWLGCPDVDVQIYRLVPVATGRVVNGKFVERKKAKKKAARRAKADEPRIVLAPDGDWDIRTGTHLYRTGRWYKRQPERDLYGGYFTRSDAEGDIVTARAAWKAMKRGMGKQGERRAAS